MSVLERVEINCKQSHYKYNRFDPEVEEDLEVGREAFQHCALRGNLGRLELAEAMFCLEGEITAFEGQELAVRTSGVCGAIWMAHLFPSTRVTALAKYSLSHQLPVVHKNIT